MDVVIFTLSVLSNFVEARKMRKLNILLVVVLVAAALFGAANHTNAQSKYVNTFDLQLPLTEGDYAGVDLKGTKVVWWHQHTGDRENVVKAMVETFNTNPFGITVEAVSKGSYDDMFTAVTAGLQTNELPNIVVAYANQAALYQNDGALVDMNPLFSDPVIGIQDFEDDFYVNFFVSDISSVHNGQRLGFSTYRSMESLFYNPDALKELGYDAPPKTWAEFKEMTCKFVQVDPANRDGYLVRTDASFVAAAAFAAGGSIYDEENGFTYENPEVAEMPTAMQEMINEGCAKKIAERFADQNSYAAGKSLFYTGSSSGIPFIWAAVVKSVEAGGPKFTPAIAPIPGYKDTPIQNVYGASNSLVGKGKTKAEILASWLFMRWFSEAAQQATWAKGSNYFPVRKSTAANLEDVFAAEGTGAPYKQVFDLLGSTKEEPGVSVYQTVRSSASKALNDILDGADVAEALKALNEEANKLLDESGGK